MALRIDEVVRFPRRPDPLRVVREPIPTDPRPPKLLDRVREANRLRHGSRSTEKSYVGWIRRCILFHGKRHPAEMGAPEVTSFLSSLAVQGRVAAFTQNQALCALLFLYRHVLHQDLPWLDDVVRAKRPKHLPVVLTRDEVRKYPNAGREWPWQWTSRPPGSTSTARPASAAAITFTRPSCSAP